MHVYDFDRTIYKGDATVDFFLFCLARQPGLLRFLPGQLLAFLRVKAKSNALSAAKESFFSFLPALKNRNRLLRAFWRRHFSRILPWYLARKQAGDVILSASPEFLLAPACRRLGVRLVASRVDLRTGRMTGVNCAGAEKVRRFCAAFPGVAADRFYSDSLSDAPMARFAKKSFLVRRGKLTPWPFPPQSGARRVRTGVL